MNTSEQSCARPLAEPDVVTPASIADYIFDISSELTVMAERGHLKLLAYLLSMVQAEADSLRKQACGTIIESGQRPFDEQSET